MEDQIQKKEKKKDDFESLLYLAQLMLTQKEMKQMIAINTLALHLISLKYQNQLILDLKGKQNIGCKGAQKLGNALEQLQLCQKIKLQFNKGNKITNNGMMYILNSIQNQQLMSLELSIESENNMTSDGAEKLFINFKKFTYLTKLILKIEDNPIGNKGIKSLTVNFKYLTTLKSLNLSFIDIEIDFNCLIDLGNHLHELENLQKLKLIFSIKSDCEFQGMNGLFKGIKRLENLKQLQFKLLIDNLNEQTLDIICDGVSNLKNLSNLSLQVITQSQNQYLQGISKVGECIKPLQHLEYLTIDIPSLKDLDLDKTQQLMNIIKTCKNLNFIHLNLDSSIVFIFICLLNELKQITNNLDSSIILNKIPIYFERDNETQYIKSIYFDTNSQKLKQQDFQYFIEGFKILNQVSPVVFDSSFNKFIISTKRINKLQEYFIKLSDLTTFVLRLNECNQKEVNFLLKGLLQLENLERFKLIISAHTQFGYKEFIQISKNLQNHKNLKDISIKLYQTEIPVNDEEINLSENMMKLNKINSLNIYYKVSKLNDEFIKLLQYWLMGLSALYEQLQKDKNILNMFLYIEISNKSKAIENISSEWKNDNYNNLEHLRVYLKYNKLNNDTIQSVSKRITNFNKLKELDLRIITKNLFSSNNVKHILTQFYKFQRIRFINLELQSSLVKGRQQQVVDAIYLDCQDGQKIHVKINKEVFIQKLKRIMLRVCSRLVQYNCLSN